MQDEIKLSMSREDRIQMLIKNGFEYKTYPDDKGAFLFKAVNINDMPYAGDKMVDGEYICEGMTVVTELCPDGKVQIFISDADYTEAYDFDSEEGVALLNDAIPGASIKTANKPTP